MFVIFVSATILASLVSINGYELEHAKVFRNNSTSDISGWELHLIGDQVFEIIKEKCHMELDGTMTYLKGYIRDRVTLSETRFKVNEDFTNTFTYLAQCLMKCKNFNRKAKLSEDIVGSPSDHKLHDSHYHPHLEDLPELTTTPKPESLWGGFRNLVNYFVKANKQLFAQATNSTLASALEVSEYEFKQMMKQSLKFIANYCLPNKFKDSVGKYVIDIMQSIQDFILADSEVHLIHYAEEYLQKTNFNKRIDKCIKKLGKF